MEYIYQSSCPPYSQAVAHNGVMYCSGQISLDAETGMLVGDDISSQTSKILSNIDKFLVSLGLDKTKIIRTEVYITDMSKFQEFNDAYEEYFKSIKNYPARVTVEVSALPKGALVEISYIVAVDK